MGFPFWRETREDSCGTQTYSIITQWDKSVTMNMWDFHAVDFSFAGQTTSEIYLRFIDAFQRIKIQVWYGRKQVRETGWHSQIDYFCLFHYSSKIEIKKFQKSGSPTTHQVWIWEFGDPHVCAGLILGNRRLSNTCTYDCETFEAFTRMQVWLCKIGDSHVFASMIWWNSRHLHTPGMIVGSIRLLNSCEYDFWKNESLTHWRVSSWMIGFSQAFASMILNGWLLHNRQYDCRTHETVIFSLCTKLVSVLGFLWSPAGEH